MEWEWESSPASLLPKYIQRFWTGGPQLEAMGWEHNLGLPCGSLIELSLAASLSLHSQETGVRFGSWVVNT